MTKDQEQLIQNSCRRFEKAARTDEPELVGQASRMFTGSAVYCDYYASGKRCKFKEDLCDVPAPWTSCTVLFCPLYGRNLVRNIVKDNRRYKMDDSKIKKSVEEAKEKLAEFLVKNPHMKKFQESIDDIMAKVGADSEKRIETLNIMLSATAGVLANKLQLLSSKLNDIAAAATTFADSMDEVAKEE
jgi:hypothetical protein